MDRAVGPVEINLGHGILVTRATAQATGGWMSARRTVEVRRIVNLDAVGPSVYRDPATGKLFTMDLSKEAVMGPDWQPREYNPGKTGSTTGGPAGKAIDTSLFVHVSPADVVRVVDRNA